MSARRSLLTATAAGTLLGALWFVPSANATDDKPAEHTTQTTTTTVVRTAAHTSTDTSAETATEETGTTDDTTTEETQTHLADTGSFDTTPYVAGGTLFLALGAGFVVYSVRRERMTEF
ncbi:LAETG motif-containing sortase-dependent surface protein [Streptomyces sp. NPDC047070]|uniref:LAETG motif-containing sortase-dependent surface protein n=1 Tax=Streptomyces sp. NPDC047070 TaxID=3154923 RepID=UPI003452C6C1